MKEKEKLNLDDNLNDFGFSFMDTTDVKKLTGVDAEVKELEAETEALAVKAGDIADRLDVVKEYSVEVKNKIMPLLNNLQSNPDSDTIYWPDRVARVESFTKELEALFTEILKQ